MMLMLMLKVEDPEFALTQLCLTSTRGELGKLPVDQLFKVDEYDDDTDQLFNVDE